MLPVGKSFFAFYDTADTEKIVFIMPAPFMYDAKGDLSYDVAYSLFTQDDLEKGDIESTEVKDLSGKDDNIIEAPSQEQDTIEEQYSAPVAGDEANDETNDETNPVTHDETDPAAILEEGQSTEEADAEVIAEEMDQMESENQEDNTLSVIANTVQSLEMDGNTSLESISETNENQNIEINQNLESDSDAISESDEFVENETSLLAGETIETDTLSELDAASEAEALSELDTAPEADASLEVDASYETNSPSETQVPSENCITFETDTALEADASSETKIVSEEDSIFASDLEANQYILKITANQSWIEAHEDSFPIIIDPILNSYKKSTEDNSKFIEKMQVVTNASNTTDLTKLDSKYFIAGNKGGNIYRTYLKLKLPTLRNGSIVTEASLQFSSTNSKTSVTSPVASGSKAILITAYEVNDWGNKPPYNFPKENLIDYYYNSSTAASVKPTFNITKTVRNWYNNGIEDSSLLFTTREATAGEYITMALRQKTTDTQDPYLIITYKNNMGLESYWSANSAGIGRGGTGHVSHYSGNLVYVHNDIATSGNRMPMDIQHIYDGYVANLDTNPMTKAGKGWRLNYQQALKIPTGNTDLAKFPYVFIDADGTEHYMKSSATDIYVNGVTSTEATATAAAMSVKSVAKDEDGLGLFVAKVTNRDLKDKYPLKIQDKSGSMVMYFDQIGRLALIMDSNQKENAVNAMTKERNQVEIQSESLAKNITGGFSTNGLTIILAILSGRATTKIN